MEIKKGLFEKLRNVSLIFKIFILLSVLTLIISLWFFFLFFFLIAADIVLSIYRSKVLFTYLYRYADGTFSVIKVDLDGKETKVEHFPVTEIASVSFTKDADGIKYYSDRDDFGEDRPLEIVTEKSRFYILSDLYLYSILQRLSQEKI